MNTSSIPNNNKKSPSINPKISNKNPSNMNPSTNELINPNKNVSSTIKSNTSNINPSIGNKNIPKTSNINPTLEKDSLINAFYLSQIGAKLIFEPKRIYKKEKNISEEEKIKLSLKYQIFIEATSLFAEWKIQKRQPKQSNKK